MKKCLSRPKRIAIVTALDNLSASPSVLNAIDLLVNAGYQVDIIGRRFQDFMPNRVNWGENVSLHLSHWNIRRGIPGLVALRHLLLITRFLLTRRPVAVIAINPEILALAGPIAVLLGLPLVHFSLEIRYPTNWATRIQKWLEKVVYRFVRFTVIQDDVRAKALLESIDLDHAEMVYVPNSSGLSAPHVIGRGSYLRERWKIPPEDILILCAGHISPMMMSLELARTAKMWPQNWRLIIHGWSKDQVYVEEIRAECDGHKVILSEETVPYEQLDELVSSADIGVALYTAVDKNMLNMGQSSGKIWQYLRCSLPVITVDFPSLIQMVDDGGFGLCIHCPEEIQKAIEKILMDYSAYSDKARDYYGRHGDFAKSFQAVLEHIESLL